MAMIPKIGNDEFIADLERQIFDERNAYLREKSRAEGIQKRIARDIEFEIEGIEDILEFLDPDAIEVPAIRERHTLTDCIQVQSLDHNKGRSGQ